MGSFETDVSRGGRCSQKHGKIFVVGFLNDAFDAQVVLPGRIREIGEIVLYCVENSFLPARYLNSDAVKAKVEIMISHCYGIPFLRQPVETTINESTLPSAIYGSIVGCCLLMRILLPVASSESRRLPDRTCPEFPLPPSDFGKPSQCPDHSLSVSLTGNPVLADSSAAKTAFIAWRPSSGGHATALSYLTASR